MTELNTLGEFGLIEHISRHFTTSRKEILKAIGDDAAIIDNGNGTVTAISTDLLLEGIHFDLAYTPLKHLGYKSVAVNISDIAAMNLTPTGIVVGLALSSRFTVEAVDALYEGIKAACSDFKIDLLGGDLTSSVRGLLISVTAIGTGPAEKVVYRSGANVNDVICVSGDLGAAFVGLTALEREKAEYAVNKMMDPKLEEYAYVTGRLLKPMARTDIIFDLAEAGVKPTSMIDISDGLASEMLHICKSSNCGALLFEDKIPISERTKFNAVEFKLEPMTCAMNGGEDYELLFTVPLSDFEKIKQHPDIFAIGVVKPNTYGCYLQTTSEKHIKIEAQGWNHLRKNETSNS